MPVATVSSHHFGWRKFLAARVRPATRQACPQCNRIRDGFKPRGLSLNKLAFARGALVRFVDALDAIFRLITAWKLFDHLENTTWYKPTNCGLMVTISPTLNLCDSIGFLAFPGDNRSDCASKQNQPNTPQQTVGPYHALIAVRHQFTLGPAGPQRRNFNVRA